jgi:hypothetical protein
MRMVAAAMKKKKPVLAVRLLLRSGGVGNA